MVWYLTNIPCSPREGHVRLRHVGQLRGLAPAAHGLPRRVRATLAMSSAESCAAIAVMMAVGLVALAAWRVPS